jgi:plastocyanin
MVLRPLIGAVAALSVAAALSACGGGAEAASPAKVTIKAFNFNPDPLTIKKGTTVTFVNADQIHHTATAGTRARPAPKTFNVKLAAAKDANSVTTGKFTFKKKGTYRYFCKYHPGAGMTAKIVVK